jgi:hypothetical protein
MGQQGRQRETSRVGWDCHDDVSGGVLIYFGWWTKAAVAIAVGVGMVVLAQTLPDYGTVLLLD